MADCTSVTLIPGPQGASGAAGSAGTNGLNAYTVTTAGFVMPAESANVTVSVSSSDWATLGQIVAVAVGGAFGHFSVVSKPSSTSIELKNLEVTASGTYASNSPATTVFATGATVSPAGLQGPAGVAASPAPIDATYITQTPNGTLTSEQSLSGLATGILKSTTATGVISIAAAGTDYLAPAAIGVTVQAFDSTLAALASANWAANALPIGTGADTLTQTAFAANTFPARSSAGNLEAKAITDTALSLLDDAATSDMRTTLGLVIGTNVQAFDATLAALAAANWASNTIPIGTGADTLTQTVFAANTFPARASTGNLFAYAITDFALTLIDDVDAPTMRATLGITAGGTSMLLYRHQETSGTDGAAFTSSGVFELVPLNTEVVDVGSHGSISASQITLAAGTYRYRFSVLWAGSTSTAVYVQGRLWNVTDAGIVADSYGSIAHGDAVDGDIIGLTSIGVGRFTIATSKVIQLEGRTSVTGTFGEASSFSTTEVYSWIELERE